MKTCSFPGTDLHYRLKWLEVPPPLSFHWRVQKRLWVFIPIKMTFCVVAKTPSGIKIWGNPVHTQFIYKYNTSIDIHFHPHFPLQGSTSSKILWKVRLPLSSPKGSTQKLLWGRISPMDHHSSIAAHQLELLDHDSYLDTTLSLQVLDRGQCVALYPFILYKTTRQAYKDIKYFLLLTFCFSPKYFLHLTPPYHHAELLPPSRKLHSLQRRIDPAPICIPCPLPLYSYRTLL